MSAVRQPFQLVAGAAALEATPGAEMISALPLLATAADVRAVVQYLRKKPGGVTLNEAMDAIKKQVFEPRKVFAYEALGLIERRADRLKLTPLGHELGRKLQPVTQVFRTLLARQAPYRDVLAWVARQGLDVVVQAEAAGFWRERHPQAFPAEDERAAEACVVCFFQLCEAAALGTVVIGKKGQPTRLRVEREELLAYLETEPESEQRAVELEPARDEQSTPAPSARPFAHSEQPALEGGLRVLVSRGPHPVPGDQVRAALDLADIESRSLERSADARTLPDTAALAALHECNAAVVLVTRHDCLPDEGGSYTLGAQLRVETAALFTLYRGRVLCLWERGVEPPAELQPLSAGTFEPNAELPWPEVLRLVHKVKQFRRDEAQAPDA
jgi:hypothetical protein